MSFINTQEKEINCKIAYYGPVKGGKSTSLHHVYQKTAAGHKGKILSLSNEGDHPLFFDFLPLSVGKVNGYTIRFHLYTVPEQGVYESSRKVILKGLDGLIFVADSQIDRFEENRECWKELQTTLKNHDIVFESIPIALQYNKRDLPNILPVEELRHVLNQRNLPEFETVATVGVKVMECFQTVAKKVLLGLKKG